MDPDRFLGTLFKWEPRIPLQQRDPRVFELSFQQPDRQNLQSLEDLFKDYGVRLCTIAKVAELGFTVSTLINMTDSEIEELMKVMRDSCHIELLVGEKYGIKTAIRTQKKHLEDETERQRSRITKRGKGPESSTETSKEGALETSDHQIMPPENMVPGDMNGRDPLLIIQGANTGTSAVISVPETSSDDDGKRHGKKKQRRKRNRELGDDGEDRQREHPFIVTEPGELARGKKNGLDYLFHLYEQCGRFLEEVQQICKERGEKYPTKVTNQVFRHAKHVGASYINKPKMRHYVHCYALHCLSIEHSNHLRKLFKNRGESVGAWRQACYYPLVEMARENHWDIEGVFNRNDRLRIWYVPTRLRQLCHIEKGKECS